MTLRWQSLDNPYTETVKLDSSAAGIVAEGHLSGQLDSEALDLQYRLELGPDWLWQRFLLDRVGETLLQLERADYPEATYLDFCLTPFTNTLPIRHLQLNPGESAVIRVLYCCYPDLKVTVVEQEYRRLDEERYYFRHGPTGFEVEIGVDEEGLVVDYPRLFKRRD